MDNLINETLQKMQKVVEVIKTDLSTVRTGRATPSLIENILIAAYGGTQKLKVVELGHVSAPDPQVLNVAPYDASIIGEIRKGIEVANVGLNPVIDGQLIRISIPPLSQERREQLVQLVKQKLEGGKIQLRQIRHDAISEVKKTEEAEHLSEDNVSHLEKEIQRITDEITLEIDALGKKKEEELMQI
jgi:ribosome recycling factor